MCLAALAILICGGTLYQAFHGVAKARALFFDAWYFPGFGFLPLPAVRAVFLALALNLALGLAFRFRLTLASAGLALARLGIIFLIVALFVLPGRRESLFLTLSAGETADTAESDDSVQPRRKTPLPFTVRLLDFQMQFHPGSDIAKRFSSRIEVEDAGIRRQAVIEMNRPFNCKGFALYQFSCAAVQGGRTVSTLAVVQNSGRWRPYAAALITLVGLLAFLIGRGRKAHVCESGAAGMSSPCLSNPLQVGRAGVSLTEPGQPGPAARAASVCLLLLVIVLAGGYAGRAFVKQPGGEFGRIPILAGGRVMPLDSFARQMFPQSAARRIVERDEPVQLLAQRWLSPGLFDSDRIFPLLFPALTNADAEAAQAGQLISTMSAAYSAGTMRQFDAAARQFRLFAENSLAAGSTVARQRWEIALNRLDPFLGAGLFYALAVLLALAGALVSRTAFRAPAVTATGIGFMLHTAGLVLRMLILGRPPVTNLYSAFVFTAWCAIVFGLAAEWRSRSGLPLGVAALAALALLFVSDRLALGGDTLRPLAAVLDANVWLGVHVVTIMIGFAGCILAGMLGHVYLAWAWLSRGNGRLPGIRRLMLTMLALGLVFTFFGTVLGGMWADFAWGRFWGWDPKENGALFVIVWCGILLTACAGRLVDDTLLAAGCAAIILVVALAWLGVNMLGVGLHSYGWISGIGPGLFVFIGAEMSLIGGLCLLAERNKEHAV